jgi:hypothetical protein
MDPGVLMASFLIGMIGLGMFVYGKKSDRMVPLGVGLALMIVPYFLPNLLVLLIVCGLLCLVPLVTRA